jgi:hypothetical protein
MTQLTEPCLTFVIEHLVGGGSGYSSDLLSLGWLASTNKEIREAVQELPFWATLYKTFSEIAVEGYVRGEQPMGGRQLLQKVQLSSWSGEKGLPNIFMSSALSISGSWMPACGMLLSHSCKFCGTMCGEASALGLTRACDSCAETKESLW